MRGLVPNSCIHVSLSHLYIPRIGFPIWLQQKRQTILGIYKSLTGTWMWSEHYNSVIEITRPCQFHFWEYINRNQTFILDSHRSFIFSVCWRFCSFLSHHWPNCFKHKLIITGAVNICHNFICVVVFSFPFLLFRVTLPCASQSLTYGSPNGGKSMQN